VEMGRIRGRGVDGGGWIGGLRSVIVIENS